MNALLSLLDQAASVPACLRELSALVFALIDRNGRVVDANRGFLVLAGRPQLPGQTWDAASLFINPSFSQLLATPDGGQIVYQGILNIGQTDVIFHSIHGTVYRVGAGFLVVAEPDIVELARLNRTVIGLNEEMAEMGRVVQRKNNELKRDEAVIKTQLDQLGLLNAQLADTNDKLVQTQSQLVQTEKMASIGQLAAGVAHEINNPLGFVHSNLATLQAYIQDMFAALEVYEKTGSHLEGGELAALDAAKERLDLPFLKQDMPALLEESRIGLVRVKNIVQNLKDFSHLDSGDQWQWADLQRCLDSCLELARHEINGKAEVVRAYGNPPEVECRPALLNQVFMNLLLNAVQAIEARGTITLRTGGGEDGVWVEISDTGTGIAAQDLGRVFDPFYTTRPVGQGTGMGLAVSYGIVKKHHGSIEVESEAGQGTTFRVRLPVKQADRI